MAALRAASRVAPRTGAATRLVIPLAAALAGLLGALVAVEPRLALAVVGGACLLGLAFAAPVAHLALLIGLTAIVPFDVQNALGFGGGRGAPGLLASDVLLVGGLARAALVLAGTPLSRRTRTAFGLLGLFVAIAAVQFVHGLRAGAAPSEAGAELRVLLCLAVAVVATPVLLDPLQRRRLFAALAGLALLLGLWGLAQWVLAIPFSESGDAGVRAGVSGTTAGRGQVQGGLFGFPVAIVLAFAALLAARERSAAIRAVLVAVLALNAASLLLTYERTFWAGTVAGLVFVAFCAPGVRRLTAALAVPAAIGLVIAGAAVVAPSELTAARERLQAVAGGGSGSSIRYRLVESWHVLERIEARPLSGSGLGAAIRWGRPYEDVPPSSETYAHNGYLWLAWKLGIPATALLVGLLAVLVAARARPLAERRTAALVTGARAALLVLLLVAVTFPPFSGLSIAPTIGLLIAIALVPAGPAVAASRRR